MTTCKKTWIKKLQNATVHENPIKMQFVLSYDRTDKNAATKPNWLID